ncbi:IS66 family insertion sequence element accessory protein TnpB, partial [Paraburkholderia sp. JPY432]|nr:IS66 family insertion sequence element accessory protein TnpB [Paraburkholderia youngii]
MISLPAGTRIWIAAGVTDMRCGFQGLAAKVQTALEENPLGGNVYIFRGRRGDLIKILWATEDGIWLLAKRLERGRFPRGARGPQGPGGGGERLVSRRLWRRAQGQERLGAPVRALDVL